MQKYNLKLISTVFVTGSLIAGAEITKNEYDTFFTLFTQVVKSVNKVFHDFLSLKNNDSISVHLVQFRKLLEKIEKDLGDLEIRFGKNEVLKEWVSCARDLLKHFIIFVVTTEKFEGQPAGKSIMFAGELKKAIDLQKIFNDIVGKLQRLQGHENNTKDKQLVDLQSKLITFLQSIAKQWEGKVPKDYLDSLRHRMSCK